MSWIPAPEAELKAADLFPAVELIDQLGGLAAMCGGPRPSNGAEFLAHLHGVGQPAHASVQDDQVERLRVDRPNPDAVSPPERIDILERDVGVLERHAAGGDGEHCEREQGGAAHGFGSDDKWITAYIGLPFLEKGRTRAGLDCWGLIRLAYAEQAGVELPAWREGYADTAPGPGTAAHLARCADSFTPVAAGGERRGDILLFRTGRHLAHVGLCLGSGRMLHILDGIDSTVERYLAPRWRARLAGAYRV